MIDAARKPWEAVVAPLRAFVKWAVGAVPAPPPGPGWALWRLLRELIRELEDLRRRVASLESRVAVLEARIGQGGAR